MDYKDALILLDYYEKRGLVKSSFDVELFYKRCPADCEVQETKILNPYGGYYVTVKLEYVAK